MQAVFLIKKLTTMEKWILLDFWIGKESLTSGKRSSTYLHAWYILASSWAWIFLHDSLSKYVINHVINLIVLPKLNRTLPTAHYKHLIITFWLHFVIQIYIQYIWLITCDQQKKLCLRRHLFLNNNHEIQTAFMKFVLTISTMVNHTSYWSIWRHYRQEIRTKHMDFRAILFDWMDQ